MKSPSTGRVRAVAACVTVAAAALGAAGCSGAASSSGTAASAGSAAASAGASAASAGASAATSTVTVWTWADLQPEVDLWNTAHPELTVKYEKLAGGDALFPRLAAAVKAGTGVPDLVQVDYHNLTSLAASGQLQPLPDKAAAALKPKFAPAAWNEVQLGGQTWGIPQDLGPDALYYRKDIFDSLGLAAPATWADYKSAAEKIKKEKKAYITAFPSSDSSWFAARAREAGAKWFDSSNNKWTVSIDDPATRKVADYWQGLVTAGLAKPDQHWQPAWYKGLQDGQYVSWISASWGQQALKSNTPKLAGNWAVAPIPRWDAGTATGSFWGGSANAVPKGAKNVDGAVTFAEWLNSSTESLTMLTDPKGASLYPAAVAGQTLPALTATDAFFGGESVNAVFTKALDGVQPWTWGPTMTQVYSDLGDKFTAALSSGATLSSVLPVIQQSTVAALKNNGPDVVG